MRHPATIIVLLIITGFSSPLWADKLSSEEILHRSIKKHDPSKLWPNIHLALHIEEPRVANPKRYSQVHFNAYNPEFSLTRNRDEHFSEHLINANNEATVLFNGSAIFSDALAAKYFLSEERNYIYADSYKFMYGLPMSLHNSIANIEDAVSTQFNLHQVWQIPISLKKPVFSKQWILYIDKEEYVLRGIDIIRESGNERLHFEHQFWLENILLPRMRHWFGLDISQNQRDYLGSDIIMSGTLQSVP